MPKTHSYQDYLIKSLEKIEESAAYIQAILEEKEPEPELLLTVLRDVVKSQCKVSIMAEEDKQNWDRLQELLKASGGEEIYRFIILLKALGLKTKIAVSQGKTPDASMLESSSHVETCKV
ncbi:transcriptional regulator [Kamptonema animale CS-326]|jgi:DNA-binding phage protein|uniref:transcriptional regulator n=1 Tax=Kamptonema animale TaxID=92934 RepID=UPI00232F7796|nr:transcriptional regulator [Kamptonema animale]MDB9512348.1 transcriptional regulator [Kamptonema animale CS-326]